MTSVWNVSRFSCLYRVIPTDGKKSEICGRTFTSFGAHCDDYGSPYLTAAAAIGMTSQDIDLFITRLDKVLTKSAKTKDSNQVDSWKLLFITN